MITKPGHVLTKAKRKEKRDWFEHTRLVEHFVEVYVNKEKLEEFNNLTVIKAWEHLIEQDQELILV